MDKFVIGIDYGTDSVRAVIINAISGERIAVSVKTHTLWSEGKYCDPAKNQYRQHPKDYIEGLTYTITEALSKCDNSVVENIISINIDTTGSTPVLVNQDGVPLALLPEFSENPNAMFVLWKDHTAIKEAEEINALAKTWDVDYTKYSGGIYSSEWVWAKMLHILRHDESLREQSFSWVEHCDWMPALLTGNTNPKEIKRSRCAAGHKAMWHEEWGGLPSNEFLTTLDPLLNIFNNQLYTKTYTSDTCVGNLNQEWATKLGLSTHVKVGVGLFDAHAGAVGAEIKSGALLKIIGTSTCDIMIVPQQEIDNKLIPGICGQVDGSVVPNYIGLEAGQSAFGDIYAWYKDLLLWPLSLIEDAVVKEKIENEIIEKLSEEASKLPVTENDLIATDWLNGRRTPNANQMLKGSITGLTLGTTAPKLFKALVEATAYGSRAIVERFKENDININEVIALGGVAKKSAFVIQTLSNVLNLPIKVPKSYETCARGVAMYGAIVGGVYSNLEDAQKNMGRGVEKEYVPDPIKAKVYDENYKAYLKLGSSTE